MEHSKEKFANMEDTDFFVKKVRSGSVLAKKPRIRTATLIVKEADLVWFLSCVSPGVCHQIAGMAEGFLTHITAKARSAKIRSL
jgi:hypothetical protein